MNIRYRKATQADIKRLTQLLAGLFSLETDFVIDTAIQKAGLDLFFEHPEDKVIMVADHEGEPVGMVTGQLVISTAIGGMSVLLEDLFISKSYRGRGIGRKLFHAMQTWGTAQGARRIQLVVDERNANALGFYLHLGFRQGVMRALYCPIGQGA